METYPNPSNNTDNFDFEQALATVQAIVERLQQTGQPLQQALADYQTGKRLIDQCRAFLDSAELIITESTFDSPA
jgi:exodeoxyribonuclease VII small subunit